MDWHVCNLQFGSIVASVTGSERAYDILCAQEAHFTSAGLAGQAPHTLTDRVGTLVFSREQFEASDGFLAEAWGSNWHSRIGSNMVNRLKALGRWPKDTKRQVIWEYFCCDFCW